MEIFSGKLDIGEISNRWYQEAKSLNCGAFITFVGTVRKEDEIEALSFDIHKELLQKWFDKWYKKAKKMDATIKMAHSIGNVELFESSYITAVISPKRKVALKLIEELVEDFKANATIWKYDIVSNKRVVCQKRNHVL